MSHKATATAAWDWKDPEDPDQAPGPHPISSPHPVPPSPPHDPHELPEGRKNAWKKKARVGLREIRLPKEAYQDDAETPTKYWWDHPEGMCLGLWLCVSCHCHAKYVLSHASYLFFVLQKRTRLL